MDQIVSIKHLSKQYKNNTALDDFNLDVYKGDIVGIAGPNGAGKTTLLKILAGLMPNYEGEFTLFGSQTPKEQIAMRRFVGTIIEAPAIYPNMTGYDNLNYYRIQRGIIEKDRVDELLEQVGLTEKAHQDTKGYSLGMKQRLAIAMSLLHQPQLLIYDEPTNGLDPAGIKEVRQLILKLSHENQLTVLISSHILSELETLANRFVIIDQGKKYGEFTKQELHEATRAYIAIQVDNPSLFITILENNYPTVDYQVEPDGLVKIFHSDGVGIEITKINQLAVENGIAVSSLTYNQVKLEERYLEVIRGGNDDA